MIAKGRSNVKAEIDLMEEAFENMIASVETDFRWFIEPLKARILEIESRSPCEKQCVPTKSDDDDSIKSEIDLMKSTLNSMVSSVESRFRDVMDSLKAQIFDFNRSDDSLEEKQSETASFYNSLENSENQLFRARNKLVICIYSICEASLAEMCEFYKIPVKAQDSIQSNKKENKKRKNNKGENNIHITDYFRSIGVDYSGRNGKTDPVYVVCYAIRLFRNCLTHGCQPDKASKAVKAMKEAGFGGVEEQLGNIQILSDGVLYKILNVCTEMLSKCEEVAKSKSNRQ